ncbi:MAG: Cof-type HAD-IIB family hydrolase [Clostridiales bacterium]|nr:Cof-type HAD-IIB family hydrolase [Clostridiales bacterium]
MPDIRLIALDLDGTLLNSDKQLTQQNAQALACAAARGIEIVPTTGRFFSGMPEIIRSLPYLHYAITINGAAVYDVRQDADIARAEIPLPLAVEIMRYLDTLPVIYDCYMNNWGWMTRAMQLRADAFAPDEHYLRMIRNLRTPVDDLKSYLLETGRDVQKIQLFLTDPALRLTLLRQLGGQFEGLCVSSSVPNNIEINSTDANKGEALRKLAAHLGLDISQTMAIGDGLNDLSMLRAAGVGVAMENACPEAKQAADYVTGSCDESGVAAAIRRFCL